MDELCRSYHRMVGELAQADLADVDFEWGQQVLACAHTIMGELENGEQGVNVGLYRYLVVDLITLRSLGWLKRKSARRMLLDLAIRFSEEASTRYKGAFAE